MTRYQRCPDTLAAEVNGEVVALNVERGQCYGLNEVASRIWDMLAEPRTIDQLRDALTENYEVDAETCESEVKRLIGELQAEGLVRTSAG
jgi:hypothetical protein